MDSFTRRGTISGTLTIFFANISSAELMDTVVLAAVGATVSCVLSVLLRRLLRKRKPPDRRLPGE